MRWRLKQRKQAFGLQTTASTWNRILQSLRWKLIMDQRAKARPGVARTGLVAGRAIAAATPAARKAGISVGATHCVRPWTFFAMTRLPTSKSLVLSCSKTLGLHVTL